jgi:hypothetical protein
MIPSLKRRERMTIHRKSGVILSTAILVLAAVYPSSFASSKPQGNALPDHALPRGFQVYNDPHGSGRLLYAKASGTQNSARAVMRSALGELKTYFDAPPRLLSAVSDPHDQAVQVVLSAMLQGQNVLGVATTAVGQSGATFGLILDHPNALASSFPTLSQALAKEMPASSGSGGSFDLSSPKEWTRQTGGDRTAAVDLPSGWQVKSVREGSTTVVGPHNELIQLGLIMFVTYARNPQGMSSAYLQPVPALSYFINYFTQLNLRQGVQLNSVPGRVLEVKDTRPPMPNGKGAYIFQEVSTNGHPGKMFALVYTVPGVSAGWSLYTSYVASSADLFPSEFADMMRIWGSWKVDDRVYQNEMRQTLQTMASTREILAAGTERQMHAYDNLQQNMELIINGENRLQNNTLGGHADVPIQNTDAVLKACKQRGYDCQPVPFDQLANE